MASPVPAKSQPLHNFSLPHLKWNKNHTNNHQRGRRPADSSPPLDSALLQSPPPRQSPMRDYSASESESENRNQKIEKSQKKSAEASDVEGSGAKEGRSKICIRLRTKNKSEDVQNEGKTATEEGEVEELVAKTWNLRPRKPIRNLSNANGGVSKAISASLQENKAQLQQEAGGLLRSAAEAEATEKSEKKKKKRFSIALSRREIEEDIFSLTGSKPARRPKKRAKIVQKQLDNLFPGMWLASITPDSYKVPDPPLKG